MCKRTIPALVLLPRTRQISLDPPRHPCSSANGNLPAEKRCRDGASSPLSVRVRACFFKQLVSLHLPLSLGVVPGVLGEDVVEANKSRSYLAVLGEASGQSRSDWLVRGERG